MAVQSLNEFVTSDHISQIVTEYGDRLEDLTITEKLHLLGVCSVFLGAISDDAESYDLEAANLDYPLVSTSDVDRILEVLQREIDEATIRRFMLALANQIAETPAVFDDDLYDDVVTTLMEDGMDETIAKQAARIVAANHVALPRTRSQQADVDAALAQFKGYYMSLDELAEILAPVED